MAQYYYTVASLPMLSFDEHPPVSSEQTIDACRRELPPALVETLAAVRERFRKPSPDDGVKSPGVVDAFDRWERGVRSALANLRAARLGREPGRYIGEIDPEAERIARDLWSQESPLEAEMLLQRERWRKLDDLQIAHYFDLDAIMIYLLKVLVLERNSQLSKQQGAERFNEIYSHMVQALSRAE